MQKKLDQAGHTTTTKKDAQGNMITTTTDKGGSGDTIQAIGKDGKTYNIPKDKMNDMDTDGTPHWKPVGGGDQTQPPEENQ